MTSGIPCPACYKRASDVVDSRPARNMIKRRRQCCHCGQRFNTFECLDVPKVKIKLNVAHIKKLRAEGKTLVEVAALMGVSISTIWNRENKY